MLLSLAATTARPISVKGNVKSTYKDLLSVIVMSPTTASYLSFCGGSKKTVIKINIQLMINSDKSQQYIYLPGYKKRTQDHCSHCS